jgi:hypothetical protein
MRSIDTMTEAELRRYTQGLQEALLPFATAADRIQYYGGVTDDTPLFACGDDADSVMFELIAYDDDIPHNPDECLGDPSRVTVGDLFVTRLALDKVY